MGWIEFFKDERIIAVLASLVCGSIIGFEREYRNKSAGFRTIVLICFGSTIFTLMSRNGVLSDDRIAANIITGIGFLGAGVIFKGKISVQGLTTAAVIWSMAAIGMALGYGYYSFGFFLTGIMFFVLAFFHKIERFLSNYYLVRTIFVTFHDIRVAHLQEFEDFMQTNQVKFQRRGLEKQDDRLYVIYEVSGRRQHIRTMAEKMVALDYVSNFTNASL